MTHPTTVNDHQKLLSPYHIYVTESSIKWVTKTDAQIKVLQKGKITIPAKIRERLGINEGDYLKLNPRERAFGFLSHSVLSEYAVWLIQKYPYYAFPKLASMLHGVHLRYVGKSVD